MAYNLPPSWDPGFALPSNVKDEGLQRRAFVTRQAPRGTYDNPSVGTAGYAVPAYAISEGYGQGAKVTRMAQRGRYDIPVPNYLNARPQVVRERRLGNGATAITMDALGDVALPPSYQRFGQQAAAAVLAAVSKAPPAQRKATLKTILDRVDPSLYSRTLTLAQQLAKNMPQTAAVHTALARSMSEGAARELLEVGRTGKKPSSRSVLGLGCYGVSYCVGLGSTSVLRAGIPTRTAEVKVPSQPAAPATGNCTPDGTMIWTGSYWRRKLASDVCTGTFNPQVTQTSGAAGGITITSGGQAVTGGTVTAAPSAASLGMTFIKIGPWTLQDKAGASISLTKSAMTSEQLQTLMKGLAAASAAEMLKVPPTQAATILTDTQFGKIARALVSGSKPIARFTHPTTRKLCVIWCQITGDKALLRWGVYEGLASALAGAVIDLVAVIVAPIADALQVVGDLACKLASAPNAAQTGAAIGVAAGAGASVGAAGAAIVQGACAQPPPATQQETTQSGSSVMLPLAIAGAGIAAFLLTRK